LSNSAPAIVWFRNDLRLADHPALAEAVASGRPILPLYILESEGRPLGGATRWWLGGSLASLTRALGRHRAPLLLRRGKALDILPRLARDSGAATVYWNRPAEAAAAARDGAISGALREAGIAAAIGPPDLLAAPATARSREGRALRLFAPFWRALQQADAPPAPLPAPAHLTPYASLPRGEALADWRLRPTAPDWAAGIAAAWQPGENGAAERLHHFLGHALTRYADEHDRVDHAASSLLSPHLRWGEIGPRQVWHASMAKARRSAGSDAFRRELAWRDFSYHLLRERPDMATRPLQPGFADFPWRKDPTALRAWQRGQTGYPLVDAAMRQLWHTGWMANRLRMVAASFLVKHLLLPWQDGEAWFWDTLVDADPANNAANWQWVAGSGTDAAPFFRIFNPVTQARKFDPNGAYVRHWIPELAALADGDIHEPWRHAAKLSRDYPPPIVEHAAARALDAFAKMRAKA
jgi:deoxyribodipyrimidine photo-lyase